MTLHQQIHEALSNNPQGWCSVRKAGILASLVTSMGGGNVVDLGVYAGRSLLPMALACKYIGKGTVIGIDPFTVDAAIEGEEEKHAEWWKQMPFERIEEMLRESIAENGLEDWTRIIKKRSDDVDPPSEITVFSCDGNHAAQCIKDVSRFAPRVVIGGFTVLDDVGWSSGKVSESVPLLEGFGFVERLRIHGQEQGTIYTDDFGVWQRTSFC